MSDLAIALVANGRYDLVIEDNDFVVIGETEDTWQAYVVQNITYVVGVFYAESPFDRSVGFPYLEAVFGTQPIEGIVTLFNDHVLAAEGVEGLDEAPVLEFEKETQRLFVSIKAQGSDFEIQLQTEVTPP